MSPPRQGEHMTQNQNSMPAEARAAPRERLFLAARLSYASGAISVACTVTQLSAIGAKIKVADPRSLPEIFEIIIPQRDLQCRARMVWQAESKAGIEFLPDTPAPRLTTADYIEKIRALEVLNAKFKAQIAEMTQTLHRLTDEA